jgi:hypothetical protein
MSMENSCGLEEGAEVIGVQVFIGNYVKQDRKKI